jgi:folate-binding protein YgfZ
MTSPAFAPAAPARGLLALTGDDRAAFLQGLVSNDVRLLSPARALWAALLTAQGKYLQDFFLLQSGETVLIEGEGARLADLKRRLSIYKLRAKIALEDVSASWEVFVGWDGGAAEAFGLREAGQAAPIGAGLVYLDPRRPSLGIRVVTPVGSGSALLSAQGFVSGAWEDWEDRRLAEGVPDGSRDLIPEKSILLENGFDELGGVAWDKGCYIGQELTARTKYRGLIKKRLMPVAIDGDLPPPGTIVTSPDGGEAGEIRSGRGARALAVMRFEALDSHKILTAAGARVTALPPAWLHRPQG